MQIQLAIVFQPEAAAFISNLPPMQKRNVRAVLRLISFNPGVGRQLRDELAGYLTYPVGGFRIIYKVIGRQVRVMGAGYRSDIYEAITRELSAGKKYIAEKAVIYRTRGMDAGKPVKQG